MFRPLRVRLTLLYVIAGLTLISLLGAGTYALIGYFFQSTTDLALEHVMAQQFAALGVDIPAQLADADRAWTESQPGVGLSPVARLIPQRTAPGEAEGDDEEGEGPEHEAAEAREDDTLNAELAAVFVMALNQDGRLLPGFNTSPAPLPPDKEAVASAIENGFDLRTATSPNGSRVRLLTYSVPDVTEPAVLQVGRSLSDQDAIRGQLVLGLLLLGGVSLAFLATASWWLAGQSLRPTQRALERQQAFVANASHELRTPLTLIRATADVAQRELNGDDPLRRPLDQILSESDHMSRLIEDQLLLSRLDSSDLPITQQRVLLEKLLPSIQETVSRLAEARDIKLEISQVSGSVLADPTRLRQVLLVLLDNAIRHTPAGGTIRIESEPKGHELELRVIDTGAGIPKEDLPHVFERFYRGDPAHSAAGSGLGLSIAKALVEAQGGSISIRSRVGDGTTVSLRLRSPLA
jgi:signal transduction histidine kinase